MQHTAGYKAYRIRECEFEGRIFALNAKLAALCLLNEARCLKLIHSTGRLAGNAGTSEQSRSNDNS
jgi:hypothetical protein